MASRIKNLETPKTRRRTRNKKPIAVSIPADKHAYKARGKQDDSQPLTEKQRRFVNAVARDNMNNLAAARIAGYDRHPGGNGMLKNPKIIRAIAEEREKWAKASAMTKKKVIDGILEAIEMAKIQSDPTPMIQGWTQIAKMCGFMEPTKHKLEVSVNGQVVIQKLQELDDAQLLALADGRSDAIEGEFEVVHE